MFEDGSKYISALKMKVESLKDLKEIIRAIKEAGKPYKYITIDTITSVEEMAKPVALQMWKASPMYTEKYEVRDITQVPNGAGL